MQNKPELKSTGLLPPEEPQEGSSVHVFGMNLEDRVVKSSKASSSFSCFIPEKSSTEGPEDNIESIRKRKFEAITGEENESTAFQGDFKLFVWDLATSNWLEKGRGQLKLNDSAIKKDGDDDDNEDHIDDTKSRLIMRVNGTLRIILNVAIQLPSFKVIASTKNNIRFTDSQTVWAASGSYASQLNSLIEERLEKMKEEKSKPNTTEITRIKTITSGCDETTPPKKTKIDTTLSPETSKVSLNEKDHSDTVTDHEPNPITKQKTECEGDKKSTSQDTTSSSGIEKNESKTDEDDESEDSTTGTKPEADTPSNDPKEDRDNDEAREEQETERGKVDIPQEEENKQQDKLEGKGELDTQEQHDKSPQKSSSERKSTDIGDSGDQDKDEK